MALHSAFGMRLTTRRFRNPPSRPPSIGHRCSWWQYPFYRLRRRVPIYLLLHVSGIRFGPFASAGGERVGGRDRDPAAAVAADQWRRHLAPESLDNRDIRVLDRRHARLARQRRRDKRHHLVLLLRRAQPLALLEFGHHLRGEDFERLADVFVAVGAALLDEHDLIDAGLLVA